MKKFLFFLLVASVIAIAGSLAMQGNHPAASAAAVPFKPFTLKTETYLVIEGKRELLERITHELKKAKSLYYIVRKKQS